MARRTAEEAISCASKACRFVGESGDASLSRTAEPFRAPEALDLHKGLMMLDAEARKASVWSRFHRKISSNSDILL